MAEAPVQRSERMMLFIIGAVQFINILDFMMVMPLGPDFARALDIPLSHVGYIGGSYTAAASVSGLLGAFFLDRFDRKKALVVCLVGLVVGTALGGLADGMATLMAARVVAGAFGGPATSLAMSIVADLVPPQRRGKAVGAVMGAFSVASVLGVPLGLKLALWGGWRLPFFAVAGAGAAVCVLAAWALPPVRAHLAAAGVRPALPLRTLFTRPVMLLSWGMTAAVMMAGFLVIPNIASYLQANLHYPREDLGTLYLVGGALSFGVMRGGGWLVDRLGSFATGSAASLLILAALYLGFVNHPAGLPVLVLFPFFMGALALRNVAYNTLTSKVPAQAERARFMSIQSAVQHIASAVGAFISASLLAEAAGGSLTGVERMAATSMGLTLLVPLLLWAVERRVKRPDVRAHQGMQPHELQSGVTSSGPGMPRPPPPDPRPEG
jgi:predicted MFS family arabinose efflux permease